MCDVLLLISLCCSRYFANASPKTFKGKVCEKFRFFGTDFLRLDSPMKTNIFVVASRSDGPGKHKRVYRFRMFLSSLSPFDVLREREESKKKTRGGFVRCVTFFFYDAVVSREKCVCVPSELAQRTD